jgi:hypothetical protein
MFGERTSSLLVVGAHLPHATFGNKGANVGEIIPKQVEFSSD